MRVLMSSAYAPVIVVFIVLSLRGTAGSFRVRG